MPDLSRQIYSATYSNVPVYEFNCAGNHVMRRRHDDYINATHILKVADLDKPARTRVLEREVQKGVHEKIQGGYGKYQGTWIPLPDGRALAHKNRVLDRLAPIFDFVPGDRSPPQAPKHTTAASNRPRARVRRIPMGPPPVEEYEPRYSPDAMTIASSQDDEYLQAHSGRKRKRDGYDAHPAGAAAGVTRADEQHLAYADELLDYFMLSSSDTPLADLHPPPTPDHFHLDRAIDEQGHTALHWAAAMGDMGVVKDLLERGAHASARSNRGETPLMRAVLFTNNFEKQTMPTLIYRLLGTVGERDNFDATVFHHVAATTTSRSKFACARYYTDAIVYKLREESSSADISAALDLQDANGDTALLIAAANGARKLARSLVGHGASSHLINAQGDNSDRLLVQHQHRKNPAAGGAGGVLPSSPFPGGMDTLDPELRPGGRGIGQPHMAAETAYTPAIVETSHRLVHAFEAELAQKEGDWAEAKRLRDEMDAELVAIRAQIAALPRELSNGGEDGGEGELGEVQRDAVAVLESKQRAELADLIRAETAAGVDGAGVDDTDGAGVNGADDTDGDADDTDGGDHAEGRDHAAIVTAARDLIVAQTRRVELVHEIIDAQALAGLGSASQHRHQQYRKLIAQCLGMDLEGEGVGGGEGMGVGGGAEGMGVGGVLAEICTELEAQAS